MNEWKIRSIVLLALVCLSTAAFATDIHVPADYGTIQEAIDAAVNGDTVNVAPGTYFENVRILGKAISLIGENKDTTVIDGGELDHVLLIHQSTNVLVSGFTIQNSGAGWPYCGVILNQTNSSTVSGNIIELNDRGIYLQDSHNNTISRNDVALNWYGGLILWNASFNLVDSNSFTTYNLGGRQIDLYSNAPDNTISNNLLRNTGYEGIKVRTYSDRTVITGNTIDQCKWDGIEIWSDENVIRNNVITASEKGITLLRGSGNVISRNTIEGSEKEGVVISDAVLSEVRENRITANGIGISLGGSSGYSSTILTGNVLSNNIDYGIKVWGDSNNTITENTIVDNNGDGLILVNGASQNVIYHNSFSGNMREAIDDGGENTWDNGDPDGGNFWTAYGGVDLDGDGLGDTPRAIPGVAGASDNFPLMTPFGGGLLWGDVSTIPASTGGIVNLSLEAAEANANRYYLILGSITGTSPGIPLPGGQVALPLAWDVFTDLIWVNYNSPTFAYFLGILDNSGKASAQFNYSQPIKEKFIGKTLYFAYCLADPGPFDYVSKAMEVKIVE